MDTISYLLSTTTFGFLGILCLVVAIFALGVFFVFEEEEALHSWYLAGGTAIVCFIVDNLIRIFS